MLLPAAGGADADAFGVVVVVVAVVVFLGLCSSAEVGGGCATTFFLFPSVRRILARGCSIALSVVALSVSFADGVNFCFRDAMTDLEVVAGMGVMVVDDIVCVWTKKNNNHVNNNDGIRSGRRDKPNAVGNSFPQMFNEKLF